MLRSRCNWLGRNGISGHLRRSCLLVFFFTGNVLYMRYNPRKHVWCHFDGWGQNLEISTTYMLALYLLLTKEVECLRICKRGNNEWVASNRILGFAHRFLGSPRGKYCNPLERNVWRKVCLDVQKMRFWQEIMTFLQQLYHTWLKIVLLPWKLRFLLQLTRNISLRKVYCEIVIA